MNNNTLYNDRRYINHNTNINYTSSIINHIETYYYRNDENIQNFTMLYYLYILTFCLETILNINLTEYKNLLRYFLVNRNITNNDIINNYNIIINKLNSLINNFVIPENNRNYYITYSLYLFVMQLQQNFNINLIEYEELLLNL